MPDVLLGVQRKIEKKAKDKSLMKFIRTGGALKANDGQEAAEEIGRDGNHATDGSKPSGYKLVEEFDSEELSE